MLAFTHSWFLEELVLFKPRIKYTSKIHEALVDKSLYTFISAHQQISDLQEVEPAVLSNHL